MYFYVILVVRICAALALVKPRKANSFYSSAFYLSLKTAAEVYRSLRALSSVKFYSYNYMYMCDTCTANDLFQRRVYVPSTCCWTNVPFD